MKKIITYPTPPSRKSVEQYHQLKKQLKDWVIPDLVKVSGEYGQGFVLTFKGVYQVAIIPFRGTSKTMMNTTNLSIHQDLNFKILKKVLAGKIPQKLEFEDGSGYLINMLLAAKKVGSKNKKEQLRRYDNAWEGGLRSVLSQYFNLGLDPKREFFLFGNDECRPRFREFDNLVVPEKGLRVKITDKYSLLLTNEETGNRSIDLDSGIGYMEKDYVYFTKEGEPSIAILKKCSPNDPLATHIVRHKSLGKNKYQVTKNWMKKVLNPNADLSKAIKLKYQKMDNQELILKQDKKGIYYFEDSLGKINIYHPDLLFYVLE